MLWTNDSIENHLPRRPPADSFIVLRPLSTAWGAETVLRIASQVIAPLVRFQNCPASTGYEHLSSIVVVVISSYAAVWGVFFRRCGRNHDSRVVVCWRSAGYPT